MAINRAPFNALVDDDGSNTIGTPWNKAAIAGVILDPADAAYAPTPIYGTFTPADGSGAGLAFSFAAGDWATIGALVFLWFQVVYPATSNANPAVITGLPFVIRVAVGGAQGYGAQRVWSFQKDSTYCQPLDPVSSVAQTNAQMSGANIIVSVVYKTG